MNDILGREIKDGDIVVGKGTGRNVYGMNVGVWHGASVSFINGKRSMSDVFLVVNPSQEEQDIKEEIEALLEKERKQREEKEAIKGIPLSKLEVGGIYSTASGINYLYLGNRTVTLINKKNRDEIISTFSGNCFAYIPCKKIKDTTIKDIDDQNDFIKQLYLINTYNERHNIRVLKGTKKFAQKVGQITGLTFPLIYREKKDSFSYYTISYDLELKIE